MCENSDEVGGYNTGTVYSVDTMCTRQELCTVSIEAACTETVTVFESQAPPAQH